MLVGVTTHTCSGSNAAQANDTSQIKGGLAERTTHTWPSVSRREGEKYSIDQERVVNVKRKSQHTSGLNLAFKQRTPRSKTEAFQK